MVSQCKHETVCVLHTDSGNYLKRTVCEAKDRSVRLLRLYNPHLLSDYNEVFKAHFSSRLPWSCLSLYSQEIPRFLSHSVLGL